MADLVITFRAKTRTKQEATDAEQQYTQLLTTLRNGGLRATGRPADEAKAKEKTGKVLIFVKAPDEVLARLVQEERYRDFIHGVPSFSLPSVARNFGSDPLTPAERIRFTHTFITTTVPDGGLGVAPNVDPWTRVESIMALHDKTFNEQWIKDWTARDVFKLGFGVDELGNIKDHFGEQVALYFAFLSFYAKSLIVPVLLGLGSFFLIKEPFNPYYSVSLCLWSITFVEWWRIRERGIAVRWGSYKSSAVQQRRAQFKGALDANEEHDDTAFPWYVREGRILASLPVILFFATALTGLLTTIFLVEAFVTQLYTGPGVKYVSLTPTAMFLLLVPRLVGFYQKYAVKLTGWENHVLETDHERSLALKTFALSSIVAYGGLYLSAFVYVPFGEQIMQVVQQTFFTSPTAHSDSTADQKIAAVKDASKILNPDRLKNQVYAYLITNQVIGEFLEVGVPALSRLFGKAKVKVEEEMKGEKKEKDNGAAVALTEDAKLVKHARHQVALPEYDVFGDYSEMVTQFGYCVLWSACWCLAPVGALVNNYVELRGDAIKIASYGRRPIPRRVDSVGPWLDILTFLTWQGALINSALVYLFYRGSTNPLHSSETAEFLSASLEESVMATVQRAIMPAVLIALTTSHGYLVVRELVRHVLERAVWRGSPEAIMLERSEKDVKRRWLKEVGGAATTTGEVRSLDTVTNGVTTGASSGLSSAFWEDDEGLGEVRAGAKAL